MVDIEELRQILHEEEMERKWKPIREAQKEIEEEQRKHREYLIANDREHLISTSRYWPPLTDLSQIREWKLNKLDNVGDIPVEYPSGYEWMHTYMPWGNAVIMHSVKMILFIIGLSYVWHHA
jgi:hypothetical protein